MDQVARAMLDGTSDREPRGNEVELMNESLKLFL
jgi:hypothetical protein